MDEAEVEAVEVGSAAEASAAVARLLAVTQAAYERRAQLTTALESRVAIEQAKGVLAERLGLDADQAFEILRRAARTNRVKLHDVARAVLPGRPTPPEVAAVVEKRRAGRV